MDCLGIEDEMLEQDQGSCEEGSWMWCTLVVGWRIVVLSGPNFVVSKSSQAQFDEEVARPSGPARDILKGNMSNGGGSHRIVLPFRYTQYVFV